MSFGTETAMGSVACPWSGRARARTLAGETARRHRQSKGLGQVPGNVRTAVAKQVLAAGEWRKPGGGRIGSGSDEQRVLGDEGAENQVVACVPPPSYSMPPGHSPAICERRHEHRALQLQSGWCQRTIPTQATLPAPRGRTHGVRAQRPRPQATQVTGRPASGRQSFASLTQLNNLQLRSSAQLAPRRPPPVAIFFLREVGAAYFFLSTTTSVHHGLVLQASGSFGDLFPSAPDVVIFVTRLGFCR
jgi:hypothetical protein